MQRSAITAHEVGCWASEVGCAWSRLRCQACAGVERPLRAGSQEHAALTSSIDKYPRGGGQQQARQGLHRSHEAKRCGGSGQLQYKPGLADRLHPGADQGGGLAGHEPSVVAARDQRRKGAPAPAIRRVSSLRRLKGTCISLGLTPWPDHRRRRMRQQGANVPRSTTPTRAPYSDGDSGIDHQRLNGASGRNVSRSSQGLAPSRRA